MDNESKNRLADLIQDATAETVQKLSCPACGGSIAIQFVAKGGRGKGAGSLSVMCGQCMWRLISDGIPAEPPWVRELGQTVKTGKKLVRPRPDKPIAG
jgi:hypothetical protein